MRHTTERRRILVVPTCHGAPRPGSHKGPDRVLAALGLPGRRCVAAVERIDAGPGAPAAGTPPDVELVARTCAGLRDAVAAAVRAGEPPLVLQGDDSSVIGTGFGVATAAGRFGLVYLDAHPDANTPESSPSGCLFGMGVGHLLGRGYDRLLALGPARPALAAPNLCLVAPRDIDPEEHRLIASEGPLVVSAEVVEAGPAAAATAIASRLAGVQAVHLHIDQDVVDPRESGAVLLPVPGGLSAAGLLALLDQLRHLLPLTAVSLGNYVPASDGSRRTLQLIDAQLSRLGFGA
jgi:arginase